ncbi:hypothetical protein KHA80_05910 [Anaerobacillus sp. HL2]|nr:hypothetical protein KHA80_05910 [Anaerobacillus sp. HL2]
MLFTAMTTKYEMAFIELWMMIDDEAEITPEYMNSIQKLLISKNCRTRGWRIQSKRKKLQEPEAAVMLHRTVLFVEEFLKNMN